MEMEQQARLKNSPTVKRDKTQDSAYIDKKRVFVAILIVGAIVGLGFMWTKNALPRILSQQEKKAQEQLDEVGQVAGETDVNLNGLQNQIDKIKKDVSELKAEDLVIQKPVQKILDDLEALRKKASESAKIFDVKGNLCEEAKRRFCQ